MAASPVADAARPLSAATVAPVPADILDALRPLSREQLDTMLVNYYHRVRGEPPPGVATPRTTDQAPRCAAAGVAGLERVPTAVPGFLQASTSPSSSHSSSWTGTRCSGPSRTAGASRACAPPKSGRCPAAPACWPRLEAIATLGPLEHGGVIGHGTR